MTIKDSDSDNTPCFFSLSPIHFDFCLPDRIFLKKCLILYLNVENCLYVCGDLEKTVAECINAIPSEAVAFKPFGDDMQLSLCYSSRCTRQSFHFFKMNKYLLLIAAN